MEHKDKKAKYLSIMEFAKLLGISRIAVYKKIKKEQVPAEKIGRSYAIPRDYVDEVIQGSKRGVLTEQRKEEIKDAVQKVVHEYGETLKLLGKE